MSGIGHNRPPADEPFRVVHTLFMWTDADGERQLTSEPPVRQPDGTWRKRPAKPARDHAFERAFAKLNREKRRG